MNVASVTPHPVPEVRQMVVAKLIGYVMVVDLLLLPYFQLVILPLSLPLLCFAIPLLNVTFQRDKYVTLFLVLMAAAGCSVITPFFLPGAQDHVTEDFKRLMQMMTSFLYFFYFRWLAARVPLNVTPIVKVFLVWFGVLAIAFVVRPGPTGEFLRLIYGRLTTSQEDLEQHLRFGYLFTDPNSAAYFLLIASSTLLPRRRSFLSATFLIVSIAALTFVTQSRGAFIALILMVLVTIYPPKDIGYALLRVRSAIVMLLVIGAAAAALVYLKMNAEHLDGLAKLAYQRLFEASDQYSTGGSRLEIWQRFAGELWPMPLGRGYQLEVDGSVQGTHSDLVRLIYSYGIVAMIAAVMFLFSRVLSFASLIIPAFMAFFINSLMDEQKLLGLFLCLLAIQLGDEQRQRERERQGQPAENGSS